MSKKEKKKVQEKQAKKVENKILNKADLVCAIADEASITKAEAERSINSFFLGLEKLVGDLNPGDKIALIGKLTLECVTIKAREGRNPRTNEVINIPAKNKLKFTAGKGLADAVKPLE